MALPQRPTRFSITGVTVLPGTQAPTAAQSPNIMRPYDQELVTCQRYWCRFDAAAASIRSYASNPFIIERELSG